MAKVYFESTRLLLRGWEKDDLKAFTELNSDPEVMRYFLKSLNEEESLDFYDKIQDEFSDYDYGLYVIQRKEDGTFVDFAPGVEIMWRLKQEYWNNGYATEAAEACLSYAKENLPLHTIWSFTTLSNKASERVMQKIGMTNIKEFPHPAVPENHPLKQHVLYRIDI